MNGFWWLCLKPYDKQNQGQQQHFQPTSTIFHCTDAISHYFTSLPLGGTQHVEVGANHKSHESGHALHPLHPARLEILEIFISNWQCKVLYFLPEWKNLHNFSFKAFVCFCRLYTHYADRLSFNVWAPRKVVQLGTYITRSST